MKVLIFRLLTVPMKFPYVIAPTTSFFLNIASPFSVGHNSSVIFQLKIMYLGQKSISKYKF